MIDFPQAPKSLCIFRLSAIGDVTHILPIIHSLKKQWPDTRITWVIGSLEYQLVKTLDHVEFIQFDKKHGWRAYRKLKNQLQGRRFEVLLMMQAALRASIASLFIPSRFKIGYDRQRAIDMQWLFSNHKINGDPRVHVLDGFFQFLEAIGISEKSYHWELPVAAADLAYANGITGIAPYVVINPCSSARKNNWRNWPVQRYSDIVNYLHEKNIRVFITGGPAKPEAEFCLSIIGQCKTAPINLTGKTSLGELLAVIRNAEFMIAPDTGPAHMASIVDTPVIALFASSNPERTGPYKSQQILVNQYPNALQKFNGKTIDQARWGERVRHPGVMELISVEEVKQKVNKLLAF